MWELIMGGWIVLFQILYSVGMVGWIHVSVLEGDIILIMNYLNNFINEDFSEDEISHFNNELYGEWWYSNKYFEN